MAFNNPPRSKPPFFIISKKDGAFKALIEIPRMKQISITSNQSGFGAKLFPLNIIPYRNNWILSDVSSDSLFSFSLDFKITPIIARTPPIHTMNSPTVLQPTMFTDRYYFMGSEQNGVVMKQLVYDSREKALFECSIYNEDYPDMPITLSRGAMNTCNEVVSAIKYESFELVKANKEGKLKGRLKEIASKLDEDDNPVLVLLKYK